MPKENNLDLPYYNTTNFPLAVKNQLSAQTYSEEEAKLLKYHQFVVREYFTRTNARGLLICHGMGQGKTRLAVSIADHVRTFDVDRKVIVLSAKSLEANFRKELTAYTNKSDEYIDKNYKFISLNASNMFRQVSNIDKSDEQNELEKRLGDFMADVTRDSALEDSMLIVDEAHNLFNAITNGAKNALALYDLIMETKNIRLIFMSGTPIINDPFELVPCFNMIRGPLDISSTSADSSKNSKSGNSRFRQRRTTSATSTTSQTKTTNLFTEDISEFDSFFVDRENKTIKNKDKFTNRIFGLCSYYGDLYFPSKEGKPGFPKELDTVVEKVPMSQTQFARYISARILEQDETKRGYRAKDARFSSATGGSSTYRVKSRQISNYCIPEYALGPVRGAKSREKFIDKISIEDLQNVSEFSPKMEKILDNIQHHKDTLGIVYSQFVSGEGIGIFARVLESLGWQKYTAQSDESNYDITVKKLKTFGILSGDIDPDERAALIKKFNSKDSGIDLLLLSGAVAEGIDLKRIRHVHIMEPFWNYARINQVKTRAIRYLSHEDLPIDQRNVQVYVYLSDYPRGYPKSKIKELTTDIDLYTKSIDNMQIIDTFMLALSEASIDCMVHHPKLSPEIQEKIKCKLCSPDNQPLFHPMLRRDMELPNTCRPYSEKKVNVQEIVVPGISEKFYYSNTNDSGTKDSSAEDSNNIKLYHFNKKLNGYAPMLMTHPLYGNVMEAVVLQTSTA